MTDSEERSVHVELLTRVEGEGRLSLKLRGDQVVSAELSIFEAPRFFEALLRGRRASEVSDIVARICGICPIAYQITAARALEAALGLETSPSIEALRALLYCGEWIESHAVHVFMLHAPDFLGYPGAIEMAADHRELFELGLSIRKIGNALIERIGGRATHPVSPRLGGFSGAVRRRELDAMRGDLERGLAQSVEALRWSAGLEPPRFERDYLFVALDSDVYPIDRGTGILVGDRGARSVEAFGAAVVEEQVPHSTALAARLDDGAPYLCGPMARLFHHADKLHPVAAELMREVGLERKVDNPHRSIVVRCLETVHAYATALDLVDAYEEPDPPFVEVSPRAGVGWGVTEAPRGLLLHRYELSGDGSVQGARIMPPTSQNQASIEHDLTGLGPALSGLDHAAMAALCERVVRAYDPCISCATHFLDLRVERLTDDQASEPR